MDEGAFEEVPSGVQEYDIGASAVGVVDDGNLVGMIEIDEVLGIWDWRKIILVCVSLW